MGAWIEMLSSVSDTAPGKSSHPTWVRGLKFCYGHVLSFSLFMSHPTWVRGLKLVVLYFLYCMLLRRTLHGCVD